MARNSRIVAMAVALVFAVTGAADAKKKKKKKEEEPPPKASVEMELLQKGHAAFLIRDYDKAYGYYKQAGEESSKSPAVHYFLGSVHKAKEDYDEAVESFRTAYLMATGKEAAWKGPALVQIAFTHETAKKWDEAKKAWQDYIDYAKGKDPYPNLTSLAEKRIEAIDKMMEMEEAYAPVRKLIEEQKEAEK